MLTRLILVFVLGFTNSSAFGYLHLGVFATGILEYDSEGNVVDSISDLTSWVAVDAQGEVYGGNVFSQQIFAYDDGVKSTFATASDFTVGMQFQGDELFVGISGSGIVEHFDSSGNSLGTFAQLSSVGGIGPGTPFGFEFDATGDFFVTNRNGVEKFDSLGNSLGLVVSDLSEFAIDVDLDDQGNIYVLTFDDVLTAHDPTGTLLNTFPESERPFSIAIDGNQLYLGGGGGGTPGYIDRYTLDGQLLDRFADGIAANPYDIKFSPTLSVDGDFNEDGMYDCVDVDLLTAAIVDGLNDTSFDLTGDGMVDPTDLASWLAEAGAAELASGGSYLEGDANLDGLVDGADFLIWNDNKFQSVPAYCSGDFNADGTVDGQDFLIWNDNKFQSSDALAVPEPTRFASLAGGVFLLVFLACRRG